jgi:hypothetical protein
MRHYEASSIIAARPEEVWEILVDAPGYAHWDSGVVRVDGRVELGRKIKVVSEANPKRAFPVTVTALDPVRRMVWAGGMPLGLFKGIRTFTLTPQEGGTTAFTMREEYTGPLVPLIWRSMPDLGPSFEKFAAGLKSRVEQT